jgi:hypothetical protein
MSNPWVSAPIRLDKPSQDLIETFAREAGDAGFDVIIDYLWGPPTEALLAAVARKDLNPSRTQQSAFASRKIFLSGNPSQLF